MGKDDFFWLTLAYFIAGALFSYCFWLSFQTLGIETGWIDRYDEWYDPVSIGVSLVLGTLIILVSRRDKEREAYFLESIAELRRVTWLSLEDTKKLTIIVCVVVVIFAAVLAVFDLGWSKILGLILT